MLHVTMLILARASSSCLKRYVSTNVLGRSSVANTIDLMDTRRHAAHLHTSNDDETLVKVTFIKPDNKRVTVRAEQGKSLYDAVIDNNVDIDGFGACEGTLCCTTCHLIFKDEDYKKVGEPCDEELDMLDLSYGLTETSRLGCRVILKKELDPLEVHVPASINDVRES